jgi:DMSO/TMAO reductase YedYZ molybdopterin-dependent catalytic subunit
MKRANPSRREVLSALAATGAATLVDLGPVLARLAAQQPCADPATAGTLLGTLPLFRTGWPVQPFGVKFGGAGLDARLVTDLSLLQPDRSITPNALAFIRTECPAVAAAQQSPWTIRTSGIDANALGNSSDVRQATLALDELTRDARHMGTHLCECSGNNNPANFGLMSVAEWGGVPLIEVVSRLPQSSRATGVLVSGVDHDGQRSADSVPGASWIFPLSSLDRLGAFLAVRMNDEPIPLDHGKPIRLVVPGWYGCTWIKWVNEVRLVDRDEPVTSQMREFAGRTHQTRRHDLARDYAPAEIDTAATPVRVEKRRVPAGLEYRIVGIVWGGTKPVDRLEIRFGTSDAWRTFSVCPTPRTHVVWTMWEYRWKPETTGLYSISLRVPDTAVPQRRLDSGYYMRQVKIDEV